MMHFFIEFLMVGIGVFLGVFVSEWVAQKSTDKNTENTLAYIIEEIGINISKIEYTLEYQIDLIRSVDSVAVNLNELIWKPFTMKTINLSLMIYLIGKG